MDSSCFVWCLGTDVSLLGSKFREIDRRGVVVTLRSSLPWYEIRNELWRASRARVDLFGEARGESSCLFAAMGGQMRSCSAVLVNGDYRLALYLDTNLEGLSLDPSECARIEGGGTAYAYLRLKLSVMKKFKEVHAWQH